MLMIYPNQSNIFRLLLLSHQQSKELKEFCLTNLNHFCFHTSQQCELESELCTAQGLLVTHLKLLLLLVSFLFVLCWCS